MKKLMCLLIILAVGNCSHKNIQGPTPSSEQTMYYEVDRNFNLTQLDSACKSEDIPFNFNKWIDATSFSDYTSEELIKQYLYIKDDSTFFILTDLDTIAKFQKKVIRTIEK